MVKCSKTYRRGRGRGQRRGRGRTQRRGRGRSQRGGGSNHELSEVRVYATN